MSFNGSGTFNINTSGQPVVAGTTITSAAFNALTADLATGLSTAICKDGQTTVTANIPLNNFKITGLGAGTLTADAARMSQLQSGASQLLTSLTGTDTLTATLLPTLTAYTTGAVYTFVAANTNTTAVTLNIDALGAKAVTRDGSTALVAGDIVSGTTYNVMYDGTRFQLLSRASFTNLSASGNFTLSGGTANGVAYLNGSKVLTTGSGFTFASSVLTIDGGIGVSSKVRFGQSGIVNWDIQNTASTGVLDITNGAGSAFKSESVNASVVGLYVAAAGNVGVGSSLPISKLTVQNTSAGDGITVRSTGFDTNKTGATNALLIGADSSTGINYIVGGGNTSSTQIAFYTAAGAAPAEKMRLDSSGNLGLGVTPSAWSANSTAFQNSAGSIWRFGTNNIYFGQNYYWNGTNRIYSTTNAATEYEQGVGSHKWYTASSGTAGTAITFTQAMTLDDSGNLGINTTTIGERLVVQGAGKFTTSAINFNAGQEGALIDFVSGTSVRIGHVNGAAGSAKPVTFIVSGNEVARFDTAGNLTVPAMYGTTVTTPRNVFIDSTGKMGGISSTRASKTNIADLEDVSWLYDLKPVTFNYRKRDEDGAYLDECEDEKQYGLIAEDTAPVAPNLCIYDAEGKVAGIHYDRMTAPLLKALQQQRDLINDLTQRLAVLEGKA